MPSKTKPPLLNISISKLSLAVIFGALLTISLFMVENRQTIKNEFASRVIPFEISLTIASDSATPTTVQVPALYGDTPLTFKPTNTPPAGKEWTCYINNQPLPIPADRFALHPNDDLTWRLEKIK